MRLLPTGSYLQLTKSLNIPGLGVANKLTANGVKSATRGCMQYIARDANSYWVLLPAGPHSGWKEIPFTLVEFCHCQPPQELVDLVAERENPKPMSVIDSVTQPIAEVVAHPSESAMTGAVKPQRKSKTPQA